MEPNEQSNRLPEEVIIDRSIKLNYNNKLYWKSRGYSERPEKWKEIAETQLKVKK